MDQTWISNMNFLCELPIVIPLHLCLLKVANTALSTIEPVSVVTSDSVNLFHLAMWAFASKCFHIELAPCSDGWQRFCWQTIHIIPGLPLSSIPQCKWNHHKGASLELCQAIECFEPTFMEALQASKMICKVRWLKSKIKTYSCLEDIITTSNKVFKVVECDIAEKIRKQGDTCWETAKSYVIVKYNAGS